MIPDAPAGNGSGDHSLPDAGLLAKEASRAASGAAFGDLVMPR